MKRPTLFVVAAGLAAFLLMVAWVAIYGLPGTGGATLSDAAKNSQAQTQAQQPTDTPQPLYDGQAVQALIDQRDAKYNEALQLASDRLAQANAQLEQAYKDRDQALQKVRELQASQTQAVAQPAPVQARAPVAAPAPRTPAPTEAGYAISPQKAASIAARLVPGSSLIAIPALVNFQGAIAYEVMLDMGAVYVDASSGEVLYNGATPPPGLNTASPNSGGGRQEDEGGGDDD